MLCSSKYACLARRSDFSIAHAGGKPPPLWRPARRKEGKGKPRAHHSGE